jgi:hypothetical protein
MPRIRCHYLDCAFLDDGYCSAALVAIDPDAGCNTYAPNTEAASAEDWDEEEEWEEVSEEDEEDDELWADDEEQDEF